MKRNPDSVHALRQPSEDDVRDYAYHLYMQSGCAPGRDLDNWLEAEACLCACIPRGHSHARLHHHLQRTAEISAAETKNLVA